MSTKELMEQRAELIAKQRALIVLAEVEKRDMTSEETAQWDAMDADADRLEQTITRRLKIEAAERNLEQTPGHPPPGAAAARYPENSEQRAKKEMIAFTNWLRYGIDGLDAEQRSIMAKRRSFIGSAELPPEVRAAQSTTTTAGGYLVPQGFSEELEKALVAFGGVRAAARMFPTPDGRDIPWPTVDDTSNSGELLGENVEAASQEVAFGQVTLKASKFSSKIVLVSMELVQDSFFDINTILRDLLAERIGRISNTYFTTGTGSSQPQGIVTASTLGVTATSGQTSAVIYEDLVDLEHSVDPEYRQNAAFMFNDSTLKALKKLKDSDGRPLWWSGLSASFALPAPPTILGYPYFINQNMANIGTSGSPVAGNKSILFGDFKKFLVRDVREVTLLRLVERYAEFGQVGFLAFARADSRCINTAAIKHFKNPTS